MSAKKKSKRSASSRSSRSSRLRETVKALAARAHTLGSLYDEALVQSLRELLWERLQEGDDLELAPKILAAIIAVRRQNLAEERTRGAGVMTDQQERAALAELLGNGLAKPANEHGTGTRPLQLEERC